ncbi:hypothetical protein AMIS_34870 [Actinoplanes missouriensis 431]|uniref:Uncharacterized protein n=1 Tax=Actinoplanes missouriensis (strain ATCC 14538 / DSM 43046 / CBS 188.64 / JCM 3121 / NBRC 102363 / NCIMB 12654 / NRRL B-3342 / UNCC 431) TaxID=512565 RepID=I0H6S0_ACTM4|nr:hypothetical protein [Actinoplanes missouriensis]BAL88707.1 hypothetical protein AMIS_34870 [Actinoplanes missouriensis 431]
MGYEMPTVVSIEWDFGYSSLLVDRSPGVIGVDDRAPAELALSPDLIRRLDALLTRHERIYGHWVQQSMAGVEDDTAQERRDMADLQAETLALAYEVQHELGGSVVVLVDGHPLRS